MRYFFILLLLLLLTGCTVGPDYQLPQLNSGSGWTIETEEYHQLNLTEWWKQFNDPVLNQLVERAMYQNLDIRQAIARVEEARVLYAFTSGEEYPIVTASGSVTRRRQSAIYDIGFDATWEIDIFGGTRRAIEAAEAKLSETYELRRDIQISIIAEVVRRYLEMRNAQRELLIRQQLVNVAQQTYNLVVHQLKGGEVAEAQTLLAEADLKSLHAQIPSVKSKIQIASLSLGVLLADLPESLLVLTEQKTQPLELTAVPVGMRADLLRRRPDIRAAERKLAASTAEIGSTTAELFPKLILNGAGGFEALNSGNLLEASSQTWFIAPIISWRIFEGGRIRAQIEAQEAVTQQLALAYEKTVLTALSEAEQALNRYHFGLESLDRQKETVGAAELNFQYAQSRYNQGDISLFELLDAQRTVFTAKTTYISLHRQTATDLVALYKALGGGWQENRTDNTHRSVSFANDQQ